MIIGGLIIFLCTAQEPWGARLQRLIGNRDAAGRPWKVEQYVVVYSWIAAAVNLSLAVALFVTLRFWSRPIDEPCEEKTPPKLPRWLIVGLGVALLLGGFYRVQLLDHSLWGDEEYTVRTHVWGRMIEQDDGSLQREALPWRDTFFRNKGNNHLGFTIPTRAVHDIWASIWSSEDRPFSEAVIRFLPLLASFGSILLLGVLVARYSSPIVGLGAAFLLAICPWHLHYSVEARGYSQMIFFLLLAFLFMIRALRSGKWRDWLYMAGAQLAAMLCVPVAVDVLLVSNVSAIAMIFFTGEKSRSDRVTIASRMVVANLLAAMIYLQLIGPAVEQVRFYMSTGPLVGHMSLGWWSDIWVILTSGMSSVDQNPGLHIGSSFTTEAAAHPGMRLLFLVGLPGLMLLGIASAITRRSWLLLPGLATIAGAALAYLRNQLAGDVMHSWYVIYLLIGFVIFVALGVEFAMTSFRWGKCDPNSSQDRALAITTALAMLGFVSLYGLTTAHARQIECQYSRQPIRQVVATVRGANAYSPEDDNMITASFGTAKGMMVSYDPRNHVLKKAGELRALIEEANSSGKDLVIYACNIKRARKFDPDMMKIVEDPKIFRERQAPIPGVGEIFTYHVYEHIASDE
ncbi:MAG: hypothetical protein ACI9UA_002612 [Pseudoalteromonas tetraodonis]